MPNKTSINKECPDCKGDGQKKAEGVWCDCPTCDGTGKIKMKARTYTYCVSKSCPKASTCGRWWINNIVNPKWNLDMKDFYKKGAKCKYEKAGGSI